MKKNAKKIVAVILVVILVLGVGIAIYNNTHKLSTKYNGIVTEQNKDSYDFAQQAYDYLQILGTNYTNRNLFVDNNEENQHEDAKNWIIQELKNAGYTETQIKEDTFDASYGDYSATGTNIVVTLGDESVSKQIIIGAHYDGDGVGDNASGVALLLAQATGLVNQEISGKKIVFIFFDGEEDGELGSSHYVDNMTSKEIKNTEYMINIDSIAFGDYCNIYSGESVDYILWQTVKNKEPYELAMNAAESIGIKTYRTEDLDGYYATNGEGPAIEENTLYTNPWTIKNQSPANFNYISPSTGGWGDHASFSDVGIPYLYLEATNWYSQGDGGENAYTGYFDTGDLSIGEYGMFMNTEYDTLENLENYFPGRALQHFHVYSQLLSALLTA